VRRLAAKLHRKAYDVILIDRNRTHIWKPLLHEVAAGSLDANLDEVDYRSHGHQWGYGFFLGSLQTIDRVARQVVVAPILDEDGTEIIGYQRIRYDYLILCLGAVSNDFGTPGVREHCLFLEDREQADRFRQKLLNQCLRVARTMSVGPSASASVNVTIVGGGATGVELAAELFNAASALKSYGLEVFDETRLRVTLVEAGPRILPALPVSLAKAAHKQLETLGVKVLVNTAITEATATGMVTRTGEVIQADLKVWAAGVRAPEALKEIAGLETTHSNQLVVLPTLQTTLDDRIFAIGDCCYFMPNRSDRPVPPRAQAAHQMARTAYCNVLALLTNNPLETFVYRDRGSLVSLSRYSTIGSLMGNLVGGRMAVEGRIARMVYLSLYRMHLIGVHGWLKGTALILVGHVNRVVRPRLKFH
jgi:NADH:ubiquinone reductase (H+-translocating)